MNDELNRRSFLTRMGCGIIAPILTNTKLFLANSSYANIPTNTLLTGFNRLDDIAGGFKPSQLTIIASHPFIGKTRFCIDLIHNLQSKDKKILYWCGDSSQENMITRMYSTKTSIPVNHKLISYMRLDINKIKSSFYSRIHIDDEPCLTVEQLHSRSKLLKAESGLDLIIVDYIELLHWAGPTTDRSMEMQEMATGLKRLAGLLDIPVIVISQLRRHVDYNKNKRPLISNRMQTSGINEIADLIIFLCRENDKIPSMISKKAEVIVAKNYGASTGSTFFEYKYI